MVPAAPLKTAPQFVIPEGTLSVVVAEAVAPAVVAVAVALVVVVVGRPLLEPSPDVVVAPQAARRRTAIEATPPMSMPRATTRAGRPVNLALVIASLRFSSPHDTAFSYMTLGGGLRFRRNAGK
jgi:hypothetical protein